MPTVKNILKDLETHVSEARIDHHNSLNAWLDYMIEFFDISQYRTLKGFEEMQDKKLKESPSLFNATVRWMALTAGHMEKGETSDILGTVYEELFQSNSKASSIGQFFTPVCVCDLLSACTDVRNEKQEYINDCACGSGRTLVSHFMGTYRQTGKHPVSYYYQGEDIDIVSVKMCALNMMIHGMRGRAIRHDTLMESVSFDYGFEINKVRYPYPTPFYSLRSITYQEAEEQRKARFLEPIGTKKIPITVDHKTHNNTPKPQGTTVLPLTEPDKDGQYSLF